jgi:hypothetical protein
LQLDEDDQALEKGKQVLSQLRKKFGNEKFYAKNGKETTSFASSLERNINLISASSASINKIADAVSLTEQQEDKMHENLMTKVEKE